MKKIIAVLMMAMLLCSVFAGCGTEETSSDGVTVVTVWSPDRDNKKMMEDIVDKYNAGQGVEDKIKIVYEVKEGDNLTQQLELALQSNQAPDLFYCSSTIAKFAENNYIVAFEDMPGGKEIIEANREQLYAIEDTVMHGGKTYAMPKGMVVQGLVYNKDMFKAAGLVDENGEAKPPKTLAQMREYAKILTNPDKNEFGIIFPMKWGGWYSSDIGNTALSSYGRMGYDPVTGKFDYSIYKDIWEVYMGIKSDKSYFPGAEGLENDAARARFSEGGIGMKISYSFDVGVFNDQFPAKCDWGVAPIPVIDENNAYRQFCYTGIGPSFNKASVDKIGADKLMKAYNVIVSDEVNEMSYKYGYSVMDYEKVKDVELIDEKKGFVDFCKMVPISAVPAVERKTDMTGEKLIAKVFIEDVWTGKVSIDEALANYTKTMNEATEKYESLHPDYDSSKYIRADWDISR